MADTGNKAGTYAHATYNTGTPVDDVAVANAASLTTDTIDNSVTAARVGYSVAVKVVEDNTGAVSGDVTVTIAGSDFDPDSEGFQVAADPAFSVTLRPRQNATARATPIMVYGDTYPKFQVIAANACGQEVALTINLCPITIPVASA